jgi:hypothetical protein
MKEHDLGRGNKIIGFESYEEMLEYTEKQHAELVARMKDLPPQQEQITFGSHVLRLVPIGDENVLVIFGRVYTIEETELLEIQAGADVLGGELRTIMEKFTSLHEDGYRYGRWYSEVCPEGEVGDAHVTTLWPITEADYQHALNNGWLCPTYLMTRVLDEMNNYTPREAKDE